MPTFRPLSRGSAIAAASIVAVAVAGGVVAATQLRPDGASGPTATAGAAPPPHVRVAHSHHQRVTWKRPLTLVARHGEFRTVTVLTSDDVVVDGVLSSDGSRWHSTSRLVPLTRYQVRAVVAGDDGSTLTKKLHIRSRDTDRHLTVLLSPGDDDVVGVGSPVIVRLSRAVPESQRALVEARLAVSSTPSVVGAWHWMSSQELHWRPPTYWKPHTTVTVSAHLDGLYLGHGLWGEGDHRTTFKIGDSHISRVDGMRHQMYVYDNGKLIRTFPISAGRTQYPTKSGVHITFEKSQVVTMDSATVGIPRDSPDGYYEKVYWDVRISYGGAFVHAAPWSVAEQGIANVSHGCVNISTDNAIWFYNFSQRGDIVDVYNTGAPPDTADPGMADWNMTWKQWVAGDAAPTGAARAIHPGLPRAAEPPAPQSSSTASSSGSSASSPSPSATPTRRTQRSRHGHG